MALPPRCPPPVPLPAWITAVRTIKKYSNRRLYDTTDSRYLNLEELARIVISGEDVEVVDASSGADLTRPVLLQVLLEIQGGARLFPPGLLHRIIRFGGDHPLQRAALQQLGAGLELLDAQLRQLERTLGLGSQSLRTPYHRARDDGPIVADAPSATYGTRPEPAESAPPAAGCDSQGGDDTSAASAPADDELADLRARLAALEQRLDR